MLKNSNSKAQTNGNNNYEDAKLEDSNEALKKSFSTSVRTKTIIVFVILVIVFILLTSYSFSKGSPSALSGYERKVANAEIRGLLNNIRSQLNILLKFVTTVTYWNSAAEAMARYYDGDTALFNKYWETVFYDGGEWMVEAPALSVGAIYDKNLTLIKGEFHPTLEDGTASPLPNSTLGNLNGLTEASMDFLQGLKAKKKGILIEDNKHMLLVVMNEIRFSNDPTVQGYLAVAADMRFYMQSLCNKGGYCMSYWEDESKFSGDTKEAIEELGSFQVDVNMSDLKYKVVNRKARKIDTKHSQYRTCPNIGEKKFSGKISLSYLALNDGHCNFSVVFRLENLRKLENANIDTGYHLITAVTAIIVAMAIILYIYLELFVFKRLQKMRRYVTRLSYTENSDDDEYDDVFASDYTSSEEQNNNSGGGGGGSSIAADDTKTKDEISRLKFMARKRLELLRCHHKDALASLTSQMDINAAVFESTKLVSLVRGRKQRPFFTHLPHYSHEKQQDFTVTKAFSIPPALELFKDYCARKDKEALLCIFFALDVAWLRSIEEAYPKHHGTYSPITVATARTVGRNYFANNSSAVCINFKKTTKSKVLKLNNYAPGMYDKALEEALAKIEAAFEKFKDTQEFLEMMYVSDVLHGTE